jgi:hypothetical protein
MEFFDHLQFSWDVSMGDESVVFGNGCWVAVERSSAWEVELET